MQRLPSRFASATRRLAEPAKRADPFYASPAYRAWRAHVIGRAGGACEARDPDGHRCGRRAGRLFADHIVELKDGGAPLDPKNGQCLCGRHHALKTARQKAARHNC